MLKKCGATDTKNSLLLNQCHVGDQRLPPLHLRGVDKKVLCAGGQIAATCMTTMVNHEICSS
ncbi:hypothetical protein [Rhodoferax sp.]|uniref:hypothetical protein n=1 Tax=Rhodoferax sp. TaxID=50421 RepID=UPI003BB76AA0